MRREPFGDLLVVVPGIMGSVLAVDGKVIWTVEGRKIVRALTRLATGHERLRLPLDLGDRPPDDGVTVEGLLPDLHAIPGFWTIDGYGRLTSFLSSKFDLIEATQHQPGNLVLFAYDWRLSNRLNAERLAERVGHELRRWRQASEHESARVVFVCHSMGGLIARWYLDVLGGHSVTSKLITIGTPYQGAPPAIDALVNGVNKGLWPLRINLTAFARSCPSIYQLLPAYPSVDFGNGQLVAPAANVLPNLDESMLALVADAASFHTELRRAALDNAGSYQVYALKGTEQPTPQYARIVEDEAIMDDARRDPVDPRGDGTVPRSASHPPEWENEAGHTVQAFAQAHASLQNTDALHVSLFQILTAERLGRTAGGISLSVSTPDIVPPDTAIDVKVTAHDPTLALQACLDGDVSRAVPLANDGDGNYSCRVPPPASVGEGHSVTVLSASPMRPVDSVTNIVTIWDPSSMAE